MKIYIPKHLLNRIPIINQLYRMVLGYSTIFGEEKDEDYYYYYYYDQRLDDVARLIEYLLPNSSKEQVNYLSRLFYSVKGTCKVFEYILEYDLFQTNKGEKKDTDTIITYDSQTISITLSSLPDGLTYDVFCEYLEKFLAALVWFENLNISIGSSTVEISGTITTCLLSGSNEYQKLWN